MPKSYEPFKGQMSLFEDNTSKEEPTVSKESLLTEGEGAQQADPHTSFPANEARTARTGKVKRKRAKTQRSDETSALKKQTAANDRHQKQRFTVHISMDLADRIRNAVYWTAGLTISDLAETAFRKAIEDYEKARGEVYPQRTQELKGGRPIK